MFSEITYYKKLNVTTGSFFTKEFQILDAKYILAALKSRYLQTVVLILFIKRHREQLKHGSTASQRREQAQEIQF